jgi:hypothetical protein
MVDLASLWLPIVLAAAAVWVASAVAWMALPHHKGDFRQLPNEDGVMAAVRSLAVAPGLYFFPHMKECNKAKMDPVAKEKFERGPHGLLQVWPPEAFGKMGRNLVLSFLFYVLVGVFVAYLATLGLHAPPPEAAAGAALGALPSGHDFNSVFRFTGTAAVMAYCLAQIPHQIWFGTPLRNILSALADGIAYGLITGAIFGWLWPEVA